METAIRCPPTTRYQGSKRKLLPWLGGILERMEFDSALDLFGGTASVAYWLKARGKQVTCNDHLRFNYWTGVALIENSAATLGEQSLRELLAPRPRQVYDDFITRTFAGIYFTDAENRWLDVAAQNLAALEDRFARGLAYHALFQACIRKRPYNLFHRANLYMRLADVPRSFGNKRTWDTPFETHMLQAAAEANRCVLDNGRSCRAMCCDALQVAAGADLVYLDPPYVSARGAAADYLQLYHFLEGLVDYDRWPQRVDMSRKHRPLEGSRSPWSDPARTAAGFESLLERHRQSQIVISYRSDGIPSIQQLEQMVRRHKRKVTVHRYGEYQYALSTNRKSQEVLLVGT